MKNLVLSLAVALALAAQAGFAAPALSAAREQVRAAETRAAGLKAEQSTLKSELSELSSRIETLKGERKVLAGGKLKEALRRSQDLSDKLSALAVASSQADAEVATAQGILAAALGAELESLSAEWDAA